MGMTAKGVGRDQSNWSDRKAYAYTTQLTRRGWAWEFLRRNPAFLHQLGRALEHVRYVERRGTLDVVKLSADLAGWGVMFRGVA
ncbi:transcriptional regulator domain-containing protein [Amorphus sp. MBR-141]